VLDDWPYGQDQLRQGTPSVQSCSCFVVSYSLSCWLVRQGQGTIKRYWSCA